MLSSRPISLQNDGESSGYSRVVASKTPGRAFKGRVGLQENVTVLQQGSMTANPKEKRATFKTPFKQENSKPSTLTKPHTLLPSRPLVDKTPLPNRQNSSAFVTPLHRSGKISKLPLLTLIDDTEVGSPLQPPSSNRKKLRVPRSASKSFETPITKGDHWNVSDVSIEVSASSLDGVNEDDANEPDYSEPEYMPPTATERPYEPPFEMPNYKQVGEMLLELAHSYPSENLSPFNQGIDPDEILNSCGWSSSSDLIGLELPNADDDELFAPSTSEVKTDGIQKQQANYPRMALRQTTVNPRTTLVNRPTMTTARIVPATRKAPVPPSRPATSASTTRRTRVMSSTPSAVARPVTSTSMISKTSTDDRRPLVRAVTTKPTAAQSLRNKRVDIGDKLAVGFDKGGILKDVNDGFRFDV